MIEGRTVRQEEKIGLGCLLRYQLKELEQEQRIVWALLGLIYPCCRKHVVCYMKWWSGGQGSHFNNFTINLMHSMDMDR